jgi:uroporphyrinogen-III synthase
VSFTSSSTVNIFIDMVGQSEYKSLMAGVTVACIGPVTARTAVEHGMAVDVMPKDYTIPALVDAMVEYFKKRT